MDRPSAGWRATAIPCPSCYARLVRPDRRGSARFVATYRCVRCGSNWELTSPDRMREQRILVLAALSIACLMILAYAPHAAAKSICLGVITDGPSVCTDVPTYAESIRSDGAEQLPMLVVGCAIFFIPLLVGIAVHCRIWCGIVAGAILIGCAVGSVIGPLIVQYRYPDLYWSNPALPGDTLSMALGAIMLSLPMSTLVPRVFFGQPPAVKTKLVIPNAQANHHKTGKGGSAVAAGTTRFDRSAVREVRLPRSRRLRRA